MHDKFSLAKNGSVVVANLVEKKIIYFLLARMCWYGMRVKLVSQELWPNHHIRESRKYIIFFSTRLATTTEPFLASENLSCMMIAES